MTRSWLVAATVVFTVLGNGIVQAGNRTFTSSYYGSETYREHLCYTLQVFVDDPNMPHWEWHDGTWYTNASNNSTIVLPYVSSEEMQDYPGYFTHTHQHIKSGFTSGKTYYWTLYRRTGVPGSYQFEVVGGQEWIQP